MRTNRYPHYAGCRRVWIAGGGLLAMLLTASMASDAAEDSPFGAPKPGEAAVVNSTNSIPWGPDSIHTLPRQRPRTLNAARAEHVASAHHTASNALASSDASLVHVVQHRWFQLLGQGRTLPQRGKVVLRFTLHEGGNVTNLAILNSTVSDYLTDLCQAAVFLPSPYGKWSPAERQAVGAAERQVTITFSYLDEDAGSPVWVVHEPHARLFCELRYRPEVLDCACPPTTTTRAAPMPKPLGQPYDNYHPGTSIDYNNPRTANKLYNNMERHMDRSTVPASPGKR